MHRIRVLMLDLKAYYSSPAYQLGLLVAYARQEREIATNIDFVFSEHRRKQSADAVARTILASGADLVAASNYAWNYKKLCDVLEILSESCVQLPRIVLGGPNSAGKFGDDMLHRFPAISALVEGEGEPAFRDICGSLVDSPAQDPFATARNCVVRDGTGNIVRPPQLHRIEHLDDVPSPYLTEILPTEPSPIFYETNRGCPYRCSFCYWGNGNAKIYRMSMERIREEMEYFAARGVVAFWLADANFGIFPEDALIADMMGEINARHGHPFKFVGVNWAKNSSERVLEIAAKLRRGRMMTSTTLALQSVNAEAEAMSRRYSMPPSRFATLVRSAHELGLDTYTDIIWGLPGEDFGGFLSGLECVVYTGVPAIFIHQLSLLPGTEFYENRERLGLELLADDAAADLSSQERSEYAEYIVTSHPQMSRDDMKRGARMMAINHLCVNHDCCRIVNFYLARYGVRPRDVYTFFDELITGCIVDFPDQHEAFLAGLRNPILRFSETVGMDETIFYRTLSERLWFVQDEHGNRQASEPWLRAFMQDFYRSFCERGQILQSDGERDLLSQFVDYNDLVAPKPAWKPAAEYTFDYDVHAIWLEMLAEIHRSVAETQGVSASPPVMLKGSTSHREDGNHANWRDVAETGRRRLADMLTDEYLQSKRGPVRYRIANPWRIPSSLGNVDWIVTSNSKHCSFQRIDGEASNAVTL